MAAPTYVNKSTFASGTGALTVAAVASVVVDDLILLFVESANEAVTTPSGFTIAPSSPQSTGTAAAAGGVRLSVFYRWATGADTTTSVADSGNHTTAIKIAIRGVDKTAPFNANAGSTQAATTAMSFPGVTTTVADCLIVHGCAQDTDAASTATSGTPTNANLTSLTERHDQTVTAGAGGGLVVLTGIKATAGATGNTTSTGSTSVTHAYVTLALTPLTLAVITGDMAANESGADTFAAAGDVVVQGDLDATETGSDTFAATGTVSDPAVTGDMAAVESGDDTFSATGDVIVAGAMAATETGADTFTATGDVIVQGAFAATESGADTFSATGDVVVQGTFAATETGSDTFSATGSGLTVTSGDMAAIETGSDTFTATGKVTVTGSMTSTETGGDTFAGVGKVPVQGVLFASETGSDAFSAVGDVIVQGTMAAVETGQDTFSASGTAPVAVTGTMVAVESGADTFGGYVLPGYVEPGYVEGGVTGKVLVQGVMAAVETGSDTFVGGNEPAVEPEVSRRADTNSRGGSPDTQIGYAEWRKRYQPDMAVPPAVDAAENDDEEAVVALIMAMMEAA